MKLLVFLVSIINYEFDGRLCFLCVLLIHAEANDFSIRLVTLFLETREERCARSLRKGKKKDLKFFKKIGGNFEYVVVSNNPLNRRAFPPLSPLSSLVESVTKPLHFHFRSDERRLETRRVERA